MSTHLSYVKIIDPNKEPDAPLSMHPQKFALWLFIVSVVMIFAALTSAYIVRQAEGDWLVFNMPSIFWFNTLVVALSSVSMHFAYIYAKKDNQNKLKFATAITAVLGFAFIYGQVKGWGDLVDQGVYFVGNPAGSFMYVLTGLHLVHLLSGIIFVIVLLAFVFYNKVNSNKMLNMEMCSTYWHFLSGLWIYLFLFLLLNN
ncbi:MAG: cytochrome c oxidase subunit 3 [Cyclobacteriaceae bacterium]|nr:cytochrome c oxidase subunit 3 [Cyclobacteriaceae bacterium]MCH8515169.1 cytochrome c oxidase subunit 3 [Cyclobacteriaceae bacterium]